ncbi:MAG TPA: L-sorbose 1-phosphate reductase [Caldithrix abyssi]|uniref:L-sorbose 1-phosphate reductase n=1 Tax=Caldithrix abyssi TaxID=187145 RepID=A0A7V4U138_CALAY|nr:L-sorbose 1-phosphate reductase [Caldithrix abyssi]
MESFELPKIRENEILAEVISNSICMSSHKAVIQGADHKRVPDNVAENPVIIGHELCGNILEVGNAYKDRFKAGSKFTIQPALNIPGREAEAPGYSFFYLGGNATKVIIPGEVMEQNCLLPCEADAYFKGSLAEPIACIFGAIKEQFHYETNQYGHKTGIKEQGNVAVLGGGGPMGLAMIDILLNMDQKPARILLTDIDQAKLDRAEKLFCDEKNVELLFVNSGGRTAAEILAQTGGVRFDDVFIFVPVKELVTQAQQLMAPGGCLNFFAGPSQKNFSAEINFYDVHYNRHHIIGSAGSNSEDLLDALRMIKKNRINPAIMITHIGGLDSAVQTILNLPKIPGGKKLIYPQISLPLTALDEFEEKAKADTLFGELAQITKKNNGLWSKEAEEYLLKNAERIE